LHATFDQNLAVGLLFTLNSLARSYALRRLFKSSLDNTVFKVGAADLEFRLRAIEARLIAGF
jgi:hypothetical protein